MLLLRLGYSIFFLTFFFKSPNSGNIQRLGVLYKKLIILNFSSLWLGYSTKHYSFDTGDTCMDEKPKVTTIPPKPIFNKRAAIYCRVSTDSSEQLNSLANQLSYLTKYIDRRLDWRLVDIYLDIQSGRSASSRSEFKRMMDDCANKKIDQIITKNISRFGRNTLDTLDAINKLRELNIDIYFENEEMHSLDGKNAFMISLLEGVAQEESVARSENIKWGLHKGIINGESKIYSRKCYGYINNVDGALTIQESESEVVKLIFNLYLNGYSINAIRKELQKRNIKSPTGNDTWSKRTVDTLLQNEKYTGDVIVMKTYSEGYPKNKRVVNHGELDQYISLNAHPAIISKELFDKACAMREERSNTIKDTNGSNIRKTTRYSMKKSGVKIDKPDVD